MWYNSDKKTRWEVIMEYVSVAKMAEKWGISERSVRNYCAQGRITDAKITSISGEETIKEHFENKLYKHSDLTEMLYCKNGCNNGDGVLLIHEKK